MPRYLTDAEISVVRAIAERIFPAGLDSPGANDAHVAEFIDGQLAGGWGSGARMYRHGPYERPDHPGHGWQWPMTPRDLYRVGLAALDAHVRERHGGVSFDVLSADEQDDVLEAMAAGTIAMPEGIPSVELFSLIRENVLEGLFSDPAHGGNHGLVGWAWIGFPGDPDAHGDPYSDRIDRFEEPYVPDPRPMPDPGSPTRSPGQ